MKPVKTPVPIKPRPERPAASWFGSMPVCGRLVAAAGAVWVAAAAEVVTGVETGVWVAGVVVCPLY